MPTPNDTQNQKSVPFLVSSTAPLSSYPDTGKVELWSSTYFHRPPDIFDGQHGYPLAYKRSLLLTQQRAGDIKLSEWKRDGTNHRRDDNGNDWRDREIEAWFVDLDLNQITALLKLFVSTEVNPKIQWCPEAASLAIFPYEWGYYELVTEDSFKLWNTKWLDVVSEDRN